MLTKELLFSVTKKDLKIEFFSGTGAGGQYRNKHQNCVRLHHPDSGAISTGQSQRDRQANIREALNNLVKHPKYKLWQAKKLYEIKQGKTIEQIIEDLMDLKNLKIECKDEDNKWINYKEDLNEN
jgi:protein subunit release factor B